MYRQYLNFYINKNGDLAAIWYGKRKFKWLNNNYKSLERFDPLYAVRRVTLSYDCDKNGICKVAYCHTEQEAWDEITRFKCNKGIYRYEQITDQHLIQLSEAPRKYRKWFFGYMEEILTENEYSSLLERFFRLSQGGLRSEREIDFVL